MRSKIKRGCFEFEFSWENTESKFSEKERKKTEEIGRKKSREKGQGERENWCCPGFYGQFQSD